MAGRAKSLWVVTSYFNPASYQRRPANFRAFRRCLSAPLLVVELARPGRHELGDDDGEIVIRLEGEDRIWQKERLLNLAVAQLPSHVKYVAWMDCDLIFDRSNWPGEAEAHLGASGGLLQLFARSVHLPSSLDPNIVSLDDCRAAEPLVTGVAIARAVSAAAFDANEEKLQQARKAVGAPNYYPTLDRHNCYGMAWAARRELLAAAGLYDRNVIGGADFDPNLCRDVAARRLLEPARERRAAQRRRHAMGRIRRGPPGYSTDSRRWTAMSITSGTATSLTATIAAATKSWPSTVSIQRATSRQQPTGRGGGPNRTARSPPRSRRIFSPVARTGPAERPSLARLTTPAGSLETTD